MFSYSVPSHPLRSGIRYARIHLEGTFIYGALRRLFSFTTFLSSSKSTWIDWQPYRSFNDGRFTVACNQQHIFAILLNHFSKVFLHLDELMNLLQTVSQHRQLSRFLKAQSCPFETRLSFAMQGPGAQRDEVDQSSLTTHQLLASQSVDS